MTGAGDRVLKTYSGGMRRRLDLAAALVANPPVLFLDEPTTGFDPQSRQALWLSIEELVRDGTTVLLTTQYLEEADRLARDIVVIDHGRVIAEGTPAQLKAGLGTSVVSVTLGDRDALGEAVQLLTPFSEKPPVVEDLVIELTVKDGPKVGAEVLRSLDAAQVAIAGLALREPSLDDVFLSLTGHKTTIEQDADDAAKPRRGFGPAAQERRGRREGCRMTTTITAPVQMLQPTQGNRLSWVVADIATMTKRNLLPLARTPQALFFTTLQPIMFTLLFTYVFGGAIHVPGGHYIEFLMPGIFVQTVIFGV